jgi:hypothetical protein
MPQQQRQKKAGMPVNAASFLRSIDLIFSMNFSFLPPARCRVIPKSGTKKR